MSAAVADTAAAPALAGAKISLIPIDGLEASDMSCATFCIECEDHTLARPLSNIMMKNPEVQFCAYTIPHPTEDRIHLRVQTQGRLTAVEALRKGLQDLLVYFQNMGTKFQESLTAQDYIFDDQDDL